MSNKHPSLAWFLTKIVFFGCCGWIPLGALLPFPLSLSVSVALWKSAWFPQQRGCLARDVPAALWGRRGGPAFPASLLPCRPLLQPRCGTSPSSLWGGKALRFVLLFPFQPIYGQSLTPGHGTGFGGCLTLGGFLFFQALPPEGRCSVVWF